MGRVPSYEIKKERTGPLFSFSKADGLRKVGIAGNLSIANHSRLVSNLTSGEWRFADSIAVQCLSMRPLTQ